MTIGALRDVTHVMESLSPEQNQMLDSWSDALQQMLQRAVDQGGPAARRLKSWLNGHLVFALGTNVSRAAFEPTVDEFKVVATADSLEPGKLVGAEVTVEGRQVPLVLLKKGRSVMALSGTCTHWGGKLAEGKLVD